MRFAGSAQKMQPACRALSPSRTGPEILVVTRALVRVAFEAKRLKVGQIVFTTVLSRNDVVDLDGSPPFAGIPPHNLRSETQHA